MPDNAVFISYAREDLPAVQQIKAGLEAAGITTWFDMDRLEVGDDYDRKIQRNIARCSYFIPVVSATTQRRLEGYFRREWSYAIDRVRNMADGALFILPVTIDDTSAAEALVPDKFKALHFTQLPGGVVPAEFAQRLERLHAGATAMNAPPTTPAADSLPARSVDERNPWLGLASFTEETRAYFYGREEEVAELARRVQRKLLTVLFGQSGLGKTSILRAGLVPRLRGQGYCPVYVRIDYGRDAPEPAEQIKQAIAAPRARSGEWTQVGVAVEGESLWEFLHHRDDVLRDEAGNTLIPLLIFDQFEEIFTLAQSDDFGRARAARFIDELADLVENRPPKALEAKLEPTMSAAERFDFARSDYRVLISLREDYLAPLEGLKSAMPSITQNRLRLAPMTGTQALAAVLRPGKGLVIGGSGRRDRALRRRRRRAGQRRGRAVAAEPDLPRTQRRAHRAGPQRDLARSAGRLARHASSATSTSARWPISRPRCARSSRMSC